MEGERRAGACCDSNNSLWRWTHAPQTGAVRQTSLTGTTKQDLGDYDAAHALMRLYLLRPSQQGSRRNDEPESDEAGVETGAEERETGEVWRRWGGTYVGDDCDDCDDCCDCLERWYSCTWAMIAFKFADFKGLVNRNRNARASDVCPRTSSEGNW